MAMLSTLCIQTTGFALAAQCAPQDSPAVVLRKGHVLEANSLARQAGIVTGMPLAAVRAICSHALVLQEDVEASMHLRDRWLKQCAHFALATEPLDEHTALLDWRGFADGGKNALKTLFLEAERAGLTLHAGYSVGRLSAQIALRIAQQRSSSRVFVLRPPLWASLCSLPLNLLPTQYASIVERCHRIGWKTFGDLFVVPCSLVKEFVGRDAVPVWYLAQGYDSSRVQPLYPPPQWRTGGDLPELLLEEYMQALWQRVSRQIASQVQGDGVEKLSLLLVNDRGERQNLCAVFAQPLFSQQALYAQIHRLWQKRNRHQKPVHWEVQVQWSRRQSVLQLSLDTPIPDGGNLDTSLRYLRERFGAQACFLWNDHHIDWCRRMRGYYEPWNLAAYPGGMYGAHAPR